MELVQILLVVGLSLVLLLGLANGLIYLNRVRARHRLRRRFQQQSGSSSAAASTEVVLPVLSHPAGAGGLSSSASTERELLENL